MLFVEDGVYRRERDALIEVRLRMILIGLRTYQQEEPVVFLIKLNANSVTVDNLTLL
jgi:hypothetical protein